VRLYPGPQPAAVGTHRAGVLVEAKAEDILGGVPQCLAEMVAAQRFNQAAGILGVVFGAVTRGILWRFLRLDGSLAQVDGVEYPIQSPRRVFGILRAIALGEAD